MATAVAEIPIDFIIFALTLLGVALFHKHTLKVALIGLTVVTFYKLLFTGFTAGPGWPGLLDHLAHEWVMLANLLGLLTGFALLARYFEKSRVPQLLPAVLPDDWKGGFMLLAIVFGLSAFLDNIAAAMIGGTMAAGVYRRRVHIGYLAAIVAAANAGGAGSVVGDTTTTMLWVSGVSPLAVLGAFIPAGTALALFGVIAARQQQAYSPIVCDAVPGLKVDRASLMIVAAILATAIGTSVTLNLTNPAVLDHFPVIGCAIWLAILLLAPLRRPAWPLLPGAVKGSVFLLALVTIASMMPVEKLPVASWHSTLGLGFLSAVFDNIPLTTLAIKQGGYDWGFLAYAVGFGGSILWFGSSAGVAISNMYPEAKSVGAWLRHSWYIAVAYIIGYAVLLATLGWHPLPRG